MTTFQKIIIKTWFTNIYRNFFYPKHMTCLVCSVYFKCYSIVGHFLGSKFCNFVYKNEYMYKIFAVHIFCIHRHFLNRTYEKITVDSNLFCSFLKFEYSEIRNLSLRYLPFATCHCDCWDIQSCSVVIFFTVIFLC